MGHAELLMVQILLFESLKLWKVIKLNSSQRQNSLFFIASGVQIANDNELTYMYVQYLLISEKELLPGKKMEQHIFSAVLLLKVTA